MLPARLDFSPAVVSRLLPNKRLRLLVQVYICLVTLIAAMIPFFGRCAPSRRGCAPDELVHQFAVATSSGVSSGKVCMLRACCSFAALVGAIGFTPLVRCPVAHPELLCRMSC